MVTLTDRRIFFLGVNTGYVTDGMPDARFIEFYRRRSSAKVHSVIVGNVVVPGGHGSNRSTPTISGEKVWTTIASAIRERGSSPGIQISSVWDGYVGARKFVNTKPDQVIEAARKLISELGMTGISKVLNAFYEAAQMAIGHGFDHVQLHGAHGYILSLMIDGRINPYAEMVLDRISLLAEFLSDELIENSIRISIRTGDKNFDAEGGYAFQSRVAALPFDFIDLSSGFYNIDKRLIYPSRPEILTDRLDESLAIATRFPKKDFIFSGRALLNASLSLPSNLHIGLCRDLIANPKYLSELQNGCQNRGKCHYFSRGEDYLSCALWEVDEHQSVRD